MDYNNNLNKSRKTPPAFSWFHDIKPNVKAFEITLKCALCLFLKEYFQFFWFCLPIQKGASVIWTSFLKKEKPTAGNGNIKIPLFSIVWRSLQALLDRRLCWSYFIKYGKTWDGKNFPLQICKFSAIGYRIHFAIWTSSSNVSS